VTSRQEVYQTIDDLVNIFIGDSFYFIKIISVGVFLDSFDLDSFGRESRCFLLFEDNVNSDVAGLASDLLDPWLMNKNST